MKPSRTPCDSAFERGTTAPRGSMLATSSLVALGPYQETAPVLFARPKIAELTLRLYGRSLHPELFEVLQTREIERGGYRAITKVTSAGHVVTWRYAGVTLTEVAAPGNQPLPAKRRLMSRAFGAEPTDTVARRGGVTYGDTEARDRSFRVRTLHTFPDAGAVVKTQTVFRLPA